MALDQKIGLGIDFTAFDRDLKRVASKIEDAGRDASVKAGGLAGELASGKLDTGDIASVVGSVGTRLATGMADGVRQASGLMLGFTAHVDKMLDRLVGAAVTIFRRIDSAMKFPAFDSFFKTAQLRLSNFSALWRKPLSDLDIAVAGGFGGTVQRIASVFRDLIDRLATQIAGALKAAVADIAAEFAKVAQNIGRAEASATDLLATTQQTAAVAARFPRFAPQGAPGTSGRPFPGVGRRLGAGTNFVAPEPPTPSRRAGIQAGDVGRAAMATLKATGTAALALTSILGKVGAALISVPLRAYIPFARLGNFLGELGDVGKSSFRKIYEQHGILIGSILAGVKVVGSLANAILRVGTLGTFRKVSKDAAGFGRSVKASHAATTDLTGGVRNLGREILAAFGVIGVVYKVVDFFRQGIANASALNETVSRTKVVFGDSFGAVEEQAARLNRAFGLSREQQLDVAAGFGAMAQGAGIGEAASASLANQMTQMAADLSSSVNIPFEEAGEKIRSALAGQSEPLRQFGVMVTEDAVKSYALANGLAKSSKSISEQAKMSARAALVMQGLAYAQGDLERTSDSAANQFRKAGGGMEEFGTRIGSLLLPAVQLGTEAFNTLLGALLDVFEASAPTIQSWMESVLAALETVGMAARNLGTIWQIVQLRVGEFVINTIGWIQTIPENFGPVTEWLGRNWWNLLTDLASATATVFTNIVSNASSFAEAIWNALQGKPWEFAWTPLLEGFKATTEQLPELIKPNLISVDDEVNRLWAEIGQREAARAADLAAAKGPAVKPKGPVMGDAEKAPEYKLASEVEIGSKEAYSIIAKTLAPGRAGDPAREGVKVARDSNAVLKEIASNTRNAGMNVTVR